MVCKLRRVEWLIGNVCPLAIWAAAGERELNANTKRETETQHISARVLISPGLRVGLEGVPAAGLRFEVR